MANFKEAFEIVKKLEFKDPADALHKNKGEDGYTFMGIYQKAHLKSQIWKELQNYIWLLEFKEPLSKEQLKEVSKLLYNSATAQMEAERIYKKEYWDKMRGDDIKDQHIANEIFVFGVNAGMERAIKLAQQIVGVEADGIVGPKTLAALNSYNGKLFDILFDAGEAKFYESLVKAKKRYAMFENGWLNRAKAV